MNSSDLLNKYQWGTTGMRYESSQFGAMYYFRGAEVEDLVRKLDATAAEQTLRIAFLTAVLRRNGFEVDA